MMSRTTRPHGTLLLLGAIMFSACDGGGDGAKETGKAPAAQAAPGSGAALTGAGATFPNPIYTKWFDAYAKESGVRINYQSIGSGGGIRQFTQGTVDFGATDGPMTDEQVKSVAGKTLHVPTVLGAVVITYNLPKLQTPLHFDGATVADVFLGKITRWNDPRLVALNKGVALPATDILVVHRSDGAGTSFIFTDYLQKVSPEWKTKVGSSTAVNWPTGLGGKGNEGVTQQVKQAEGAIGYVELVYAKENGLPVAQLRNAAGSFVGPTLTAVSAAAAAAAETMGGGSDFRVSITNAGGAESYPISSFTWLLVHQDQLGTPKGRQLKRFMEWMLAPEAQRMAADLGYGPLPSALIENIQQRLAKSVTTP